VDQESGLDGRQAQCATAAVTRPKATHARTSSLSDCQPGENAQKDQKKKTNFTHNAHAKEDIAIIMKAFDYSNFT